MKKRKPKSSKPAPSKNPQAPAPKPRSFDIEALEPRILLSATWTGTSGDDSHSATNGGDDIHGLAGHDTLHGGTGKDLIDGGTGNDHLYGNQGNDDLFSGGGNDLMDGEQGSDTFHFDGAQHGDTATVVGGSGNDTIDLSGYHNDQVHESGGTITVDLGGGHSFTINHSQVENIVTADGSYIPGSVPVPTVNNAPHAVDENVTLNEDSSGVIHLSGTDPDSGDAIDHYVVDNLPDHGTLMLNGNAVHAGDSVSQADIDAGHLTFQPDANWHGDTSFGFHAHDGDALSANSGTFGLHVDPMNDAPLANHGSISGAADAPLTVGLSGTDSDTGDSVEQYRIESLPDHGTLLLNGSAVHTGDVVSQADITAGHLTFQPDAVWSGSTSLTFRAHDGDAWSIDAATFDLGVSSANHAPITLDGTVNHNEDGGPIAVSLAGTDPDAGDTIDHYRVESLPDHGTLLLNGSAVHAGDSISQTDIDAGHLTFQPDADWHGDTSFGFRAHDGDLFANNLGSFNISVAAANNAPTASDGSLTLNEDGNGVVTLNGTDSDTGNAVDHYVVDSTPDHGTLLLNGNAVHAGDSITQADVDAGHLTFQPDANWHGDTSFGFHAHDGEALSTNAGTFTLHVDAVNDAASVDAGADVTVDGGATVNLRADASDLEGDALSHTWTQVGGPGVTISGDHGPTPSFTAPDVDSPTTLTFQVQVNDGHDITTDTVSVLVNPVAAASGDGSGPVAEAPPAVNPPVETPHDDPVAEVPNDSPHVDPHDGPVAEVPGDPAPPNPVDEAPSAPPPIDTPHIDTPSVDAAPPVDGDIHTPPAVEAPSVTPYVPTISVVAPPVGSVPVHHVVDVATPVTGVTASPAEPAVPNLPTDGTHQPAAPAPTVNANPALGVNAMEGHSSDHNGTDVIGSAPVRASSNDHITWDGHEEMQVMDPHADFGDALDHGAAHSGDSSDPSLEPTPVPFSNAIESQFNVTQVVTLPTFALTGSPVNMVPPMHGAGPGSLDDAFITERDAGAARRWASRYSDEQAGISNSWFDDQHDDARGSPEESGVYAEAETGGFFARLWGAVRGLGASASRNASDERENKRS